MTELDQYKEEARVEKIEMELIRLPKYRWRITEDHLPPMEGYSGDVGTEGPFQCSPLVNMNEADWECFDDDMNLCYRGKIWGDYTGFEPMDDFCQPNAGCTTIKINGEIL